MRKLSETQIQNEIGKLEDQIKELEAKKYYLQTAIDYKEDVYDKADFVEDCNNKIKDRMFELGLAGTHDVRVDLNISEGLHKPDKYIRLHVYIDEQLAFDIVDKINILPTMFANSVLRNLKLVLAVHDAGLNMGSLLNLDGVVNIQESGLSINIRLDCFLASGQTDIYTLKASTQIADINDSNEVDRDTCVYRPNETRRIDFNMSKSSVELKDVPDVAKQFITAYKDALDCVDLKVKKRQELAEEDNKSEDISEKKTYGLDEIVERLCD